MDGEIIHHITNFKKFYRTIGYPNLAPNLVSSKEQMIKDAALLIAFIKNKSHNQNGVLGQRGAYTKKFLHISMKILEPFKKIMDNITKT